MATTQPAIAIPGVSPKVNDILLWRDAKTSGGIFAACCTVYIVFHVLGYNPLVLLAQLAAVGIMTTLLWQYGAALLGRAGPPVPAVLTQGLSQETVASIGEKLRVTVNSFLGVVAQLASGSNAKLSAQAFTAALAFSWVAARLSLPTTAFVAVLLAFSLPKGYELKKDEVDKFVSLTKSQVNDYYTKASDLLLKKAPKDVPKKVQ